MQITNKNLEELIPYKNNPRINKNSIEEVAKSIKEYGFKVPIIIDKNNIIISGHTRYEASKLLKLKKIPCIVADDLTEEQIRAFRLADNKVAEFSKWDYDKLKEELSKIKNDLFDFEFYDELDVDDINIDEYYTDESTEKICICPNCGAKIEK